MLKSICLHINDLCNLQCTHCWSNSGPSGKNKLLPDDILNFVSILIPIGLLRISLSGGEPLLHPNISYIVKKLLDLGLQVTLTTNGTLPRYLSNLLSQLSKDQKANLSIRVSIDGPEEVCNSLRGENVYSRALSSIEYIGKELGVVPVNAVVGLDIDKSQWLNFYEVLSSLRVSELALITLAPRGKGLCLSSDKKAIRSNIKEIELLSESTSFNGRILVWDYLTIEHGYLLVEHDGRVILPGQKDANDILVGTVDSLTTDIVSSTLRSKRKALNYSYTDTLEKGN